MLIYADHEKKIRPCLWMDQAENLAVVPWFRPPTDFIYKKHYIQIFHQFGFFVKLHAFEN